MRSAIISEIHKIMHKDKKVFFLTGDLGYSTLEKIEKDFPKRFINVGIAEQNMIGIAAGLALSGKKVFVYSIIPFVTLRCLEQIKNDICYHNLDVTILGIGAGMSYGTLGSTHFALEDIAVLRPIPNISIFSPADKIEAALGIKYLSQYRYPVYIRIGRNQENVIYRKPYSFKFGKGVLLSKGKDIVIFSTGSIIIEVLAAMQKLITESKISVTLVNIHTLKPIDRDLILKTSENKKAIFVIEEHNNIGGLGSAVLEILAEEPNMPLVFRINTGENFIKTVGTNSYLRNELGLSAEHIFQKINSALS